MAHLEEENYEQPQYSITSEAPSDAHLPPQNYQPTDYEQQYHHQQATAPPNESVAYPPPQYAGTPPPQYAQTAGMMPPPHPQPWMMPPPHPHPGMMPPPHPHPGMMPPPHPHPGMMPPPHVIPTPQPAKEGWRTDLFGCFDDPTNALITLCCPCVTFGQIAEILDNGQTSCATSGVLYSLILFCIAMPCLITCSYRTKLRSRYNLVETPAPDWLTHCFCEPCALCQAYRELNLRGMDPSIGWQGNLQRQQQAAMMVPPMQPGMMHR